jgi:UDPglucose--hexose-1-phosphate uridylyltransferase
MPELRHDPIQRRWIIISTDRARRPTDFTHEKATVDSVSFDPFSPGMEDKTPPEIFAFREKSAEPNKPGWKVRVVPNKFPALKIEGELDREGVGLYDKMNGVGAHEVIIETPVLGETIATMKEEQLKLVLKAYRERLVDLMRDARFRYILIFKNHGLEAGASLAHSHTQIIATPITPKTVALELESAKAYFHVKERCIFCDLMKQELADGSRIVTADEHFVVYCPYASRFPFEMVLLPRAHAHRFGEISDELIGHLAVTLKETLARLSVALDDPPYNFMLHTAPNTTVRARRANYWETLAFDWHWHLEIIPRVTKTAGFEWGTGFYINPVPPENAASFLREVELK